MDFGSPPVQYTGGQVRILDLELSKEEKILLFLGTTLITPVGWAWRGPSVGAVVFWKLRQLGLAAGLILDSSGGGGPGEPLTSTESPSSLEKVAIDHGLLVRKASEHTSSPAAAGNSAHGGRRSGSKPRKRCPPGYRWNGRRCVKR